ncbi:hypothetical protein AALP_AA6G195900 [Arabis alpina]|uniref:Uncharacterized protein n=1 Tax=Arabis alpina TaxID=50452 RepID=A0A087GQC1_ARAAL|nr:hypothetical protein AALP_AA6G195900 [Arabis alpina]
MPPQQYTITRSGPRHTDLATTTHKISTTAPQREARQSKLIDQPK